MGSSTGHRRRGTVPGEAQAPKIPLATAAGLSPACPGRRGLGGARSCPMPARPTWMVTMRGSGCRVFAPPSMAMPKVGALLDTRIRHDVGSRSPGCGDRWQRCQRGPDTVCQLCSLGQGPTAGRDTLAATTEGHTQPCCCFLTPGRSKIPTLGRSGRVWEGAEQLSACLLVSLSFTTTRNPLSYV